MKNKTIKRHLNKIESFKNKSKALKVLLRPYKYFILLMVHHLLVPRFYSKVEMAIELFFGENFIVDLPAHFDIFLYGCKVSKSDLLLQHYLNEQLQPNVVFFDIGASLGYYSLFVRNIIGNKGFIYAIEPSRIAFDILNRNTAKYENIYTFNIAIGNANKPSVIYEFPTRYNEYNTLKVDAFIKNANWSKTNLPVKKSVNMRTLDSLVHELNIIPDIIKLDIEGSEELLLDGVMDVIHHHFPALIMRYWPDHRNNTSQLNSIQILLNHDYEMYSLIDNNTIQFNKLSEYDCEYILLKKRK